MFQKAQSRISTMFGQFSYLNSYVTAFSEKPIQSNSEVAQYVHSKYLEASQCSCLTFGHAITDVNVGAKTRIFLKAQMVDMQKTEDDSHNYDYRNSKKIRNLPSTFSKYT